MDPYFRNFWEQKRRIATFEFASRRVYPMQYSDAQDLIAKPQKASVVSSTLCVKNRRTTGYWSKRIIEDYKKVIREDQFLNNKRGDTFRRERMVDLRLYAT